VADSRYPVRGTGGTRLACAAPSWAEDTQQPPFPVPGDLAARPQPLRAWPCVLSPTQLPPVPFPCVLVDREWWWASRDPFSAALQPWGRGPGRRACGEAFHSWFGFRCACTCLRKRVWFVRVARGGSRAGTCVLY